MILTISGRIIGIWIACTILIGFIFTLIYGIQLYTTDRNLILPINLKGTPCWEDLENEIMLPSFSALSCGFNGMGARAWRTGLFFAMPALIFFKPLLVYDFISRKQMYGRMKSICAISIIVKYIGIFCLAIYYNYNYRHVYDKLQKIYDEAGYGEQVVTTFDAVFHNIGFALYMLGQLTCFYCLGKIIKPAKIILCLVIMLGTGHLSCYFLRVYVVCTKYLWVTWNLCEYSLIATTIFGWLYLLKFSELADCFVRVEASNGSSLEQEKLND